MSRYESQSPALEPGAKPAAGPSRVLSWKRAVARGSCPIMFLVLIAGGSLPAMSQTERPDSYDEFFTVTAGEECGLGCQLKNLAEDGDPQTLKNYLYLAPGSYVLDNPVVINRTGPLFIHGGDRMETRLIALNSGAPLFRIDDGSLVSFAGVRFQRAVSEENARAVSIGTWSSEQELELEVLDSLVYETRLVFDGPVKARVQVTSFITQGKVMAPIEVDDDEADVLIVGGNIYNSAEPASFDPDESFHVWQKRGRLRIYGTAVQKALGDADFRIESASNLGPHVIANVRSEGNTSGEESSKRPSRLLQVDDGGADDNLDVLVLNNAGSWPTVDDEPDDAKFMTYDSAGTVWLIGNNSFEAASTLIESANEDATIVAYGNRIRKDLNDALLDACVTNDANKRFFCVGNVRTRDSSDAYDVQFVLGAAVEEQEIDDGPPDVPEVLVPDHAPRPRVDSVMAGMLDVTTFGAVADDAYDDWCPIQQALYLGKMVYLPAGEYRVSKPLGFVLSCYQRCATPSKCPSPLPSVCSGISNPSCILPYRDPHGAGGWIAGAGSDLTTIKSTAGGSVFLTDGMAYATVQGITFETTAYDLVESTPTITVTNVGLENTPGFGNATQEVSFYDTVFDGGRYALSMGVSSTTNCAQNLMVDSEFRNAKYGLGVGSYNALSNIVYDGRFNDNHIAMGHSEGLKGGTWAVLNAEVRGTGDKDLHMTNSADGVWYFHGLDSDSPKFHFKDGVTGSVFPMLFEQSSLERDVNGWVNSACYEDAYTSFPFSCCTGLYKGCDVGECTASQTPYEFCTAEDMGALDNDMCQGAGDPLNCCTGNQQGHCADIFRQLASGGSIFLHSTVGPGGLIQAATQADALNFMFKIQSAVEGWPPDIQGGGHRHYEMP